MQHGRASVLLPPLVRTNLKGLKQCFVERENCKVTSKVVRKVLENHCGEMNNNEFGKIIRAAFPSVVKKKSGSKIFYYGISEIDDVIIDVSDLDLGIIPAESDVRYPGLTLNSQHHASFENSGECNGEVITEKFCHEFTDELHDVKSRRYDILKQAKMPNKNQNATFTKTKRMLRSFLLGKKCLEKYIPADKMTSQKQVVMLTPCCKHVVKKIEFKKTTKQRIKNETICIT
ncbi:Uncharacterised protein r2_g1404 [Pycnogonum litorale]